MSDITPNEPVKAQSWLPQLRSRWWALVLGLSLMLNLLVGGIIVGGAFGPHRAERLAGASYIQLIPRNFFRQLPKDRREALMQIVKNNRDDLKNLRSAYETNSLKLAEALEQENFSLDAVRATVAAFSTGTESLAARGGEVVLHIVEQLTPDERKLLAEAIRNRDDKDGKRRRD